MRLASVIGDVAAPAAHAASTGAPVAGGLLSMAASLLLVLAAIVVLAWLARALQRTRGARAGVLQLHGGLQVGPKERVVLLQVGGEHFMVGVAPGCVTLLHKFMVAPVAEEASSTVVSFAERLKQLHRRQ